VVIWLGRCAQAAGWLVVALLVGVALYGLAVPRPDAVGAVAAEPSRVAGVEIAELQGRWLENAVAGPMYVVSGRLENPSTHLVTTEGRLALRLLDARGGVVDGDAAPVGLPLPEPQLRADDPRELQARLGMESRTLARVPFEPGASRRFQAVLPAPPDAALRFDLVSLPLDQAPAAPAT
jgi:hypothetical protein